MKQVLHLEIFNDILAKATACVFAFTASSSKWLVRAKNEMLALYGKALAILRIGETRWNSAQMMFASLLRVKTALKKFIITHQDDPDIPDAFLCLSENSFWTGTWHELKLSVILLMLHRC